MAPNDLFLNIDGTRIPRFFYGTAWKEEQTAALVGQAIRSGFRSIDTANQRKHYFEQAVGEGISGCIADGTVKRAELFVQSKFTFRRGQDERLPYDPAAPVGEQVEQSFASSLEHLGLEHLDSLVLHGPSRGSGLVDEDWAAWRAMEAIRARGGCRFLGISNVQLDQLQALTDGVKMPPQFVQNRCYAVRGWDRSVRRFCQEHNMIYQGFSLLTANRDILGGETVGQIATRHGCTPAQVIFRFALDVGMLPLTGTTSQKHMQEDLAVFDLCLERGEVARIDKLAG